MITARIPITPPIIPGRGNFELYSPFVYKLFQNQIVIGSFLSEDNLGVTTRRVGGEV
jgi:hypothetical protein